MLEINSSRSQVYCAVQEPADHMENAQCTAVPGYMRLHRRGQVLSRDQGRRPSRDGVHNKALKA